MTEQEKPEWFGMTLTIWGSPRAHLAGLRETIAEAWRRIFGEEIPESGGEEVEFDGANYTVHERAIICKSKDAPSILVTSEQLQKLPDWMLKGMCSFPETKG